MIRNKYISSSSLIFSAIAGALLNRFAYIRQINLISQNALLVPDTWPMYGQDELSIFMSSELNVFCWKPGLFTSKQLKIYAYLFFSTLKMINGILSKIRYKHLKNIHLRISEFRYNKRKFSFTCRLKSFNPGW